MSMRQSTSALLLSLLAGCAVHGRDVTSESPIVSEPRLTVDAFTSDASGFDTHSFWIDTGSEVVVFDAQFTPELGQKVVDAIRAKTPHPITWVVVTHPNPDKFNGVEPFRAAGAKVIASKHTADAIPGVYDYKKAYFVNAGMFTNDTYPARPTIDRTFEGSVTVAGIELRELSRPGVSSTQTVARAGSNVLVGDLVHHGAHAWLEGGIVDGRPKPDIEGWRADLDELRSLYPDATVFGGRGESAPIDVAVADQKAYLDRMTAIVRDEVAKGAVNADTYAAIQKDAERAYPSYALSYLVGYGVYGLALQIQAEGASAR